MKTTIIDNADEDSWLEEKIAAGEALTALGLDRWKTEDGREVDIPDMEDSHLLNCINMIHRRKGQWRQRFFERLYNEARRRGLAV